MAVPDPQPEPLLDQIPPGTSIIPPDWFVARVNAANPGGRFRTALDPVVMTLWAFAVTEPPSPLLLVTGI